MDTSHEGASELENCDGGTSTKEQPSLDKKQQKCNDKDVIGQDAIEELVTTFQTLRVEERDFRFVSYLPFTHDGSSGMDEEIISLENYDVVNPPLHKWRTFHTEEFELQNNSLRRTISLPSASNLVSSMKGNRKKSGTTMTKLSVSWAPDVFDPRPTYLSYIPKKKTLSRQHIKSNKKYGKGKQKGKNMRGGGSGTKEKKHYQKVSGRAKRCIYSYVEIDKVISSRGYKSSAQLSNFDYDDEGDYEDDFQSPESLYGGSYLGKNHDAICFAYAKAK